MERCGRRDNCGACSRNRKLTLGGFCVVMALDFFFWTVVCVCTSAGAAPVSALLCNKWALGSQSFENRQKIANLLKETQSKRFKGIWRSSGIAFNCCMQACSKYISNRTISIVQRFFVRSQVFKLQAFKKKVEDVSTSHLQRQMKNFFLLRLGVLKNFKAKILKVCFKYNNFCQLQIFYPTSSFGDMTIKRKVFGISSTNP